MWSRQQQHCQQQREWCASPSKRCWCCDDDARSPCERLPVRRLSSAHCSLACCVCCVCCVALASGRESAKRGGERGAAQCNVRAAAFAHYPTSLRDLDGNASLTTLTHSTDGRGGHACIACRQCPCLSQHIGRMERGATLVPTLALRSCQSQPSEANEQASGGRSERRGRRRYKHTQTAHTHAQAPLSLSSHRLVRRPDTRN